VQQRLFGRAATFPGKAREGSDSPAVLAQLNGSLGGEFLDAGVQFGGEVLAADYKKTYVPCVRFF
jgi:hypothetical protein